MSKPLVIVVDTDAIVAQVKKDDKNHQAATAISRSLVSSNAQVIYPATTVVEAVTFIQRPLNNLTVAYGTARLMAGSSAQVVAVNQKTLNNAMKYFSATGSKKNTLFDCIVIAVAEEYHADAIFSFDRFYKKQGFKLVSEISPSTRKPPTSVGG